MDFFSDKRLSFKAKGILALALAQPKGFKFSEAFFVVSSCDKLSAVKSGLSQLIKFGYLTRSKTKTRLMNSGYNYVFRATARACENQMSPSIVNNLVNIYNNKYNIENIEKCYGINSEETIIVKFFLQKFEQAMKCQHPKYTLKLWKECLSKIYKVLDKDGQNLVALTNDDILPLVEKYFITKFPKKCDYNFAHFANESIMYVLFWKSDINLMRKNL